MPRVAAVFVDEQLRMEVASIDSAKTVIVRLNRIQAQQLSDALLAYAGLAHKGFGRSRSTGIGVLDLTEMPPQPKKSSPVRLKSGGFRAR